MQRLGSMPPADDSALEEMRSPAAALAWRAGFPTDQAAAAALLQEQMIPLYTYEIDDHIARLEAVAESELASAFRAWRERLIT
jgi:hypothetical protein